MARTALIALLAWALLVPAASAGDREATQRVLETSMRQAGGASSAYVVDLVTGEPLFAEDADVPRIPASVEKLYTSASALLRYGPEGTLRTGVLAGAAPDAAGVVAGDLYLRGGGDPSFGGKAAALLGDALVDEIGITEVTGRVVGDESAFDGLRGPPSEGFRTSLEVGPLSALTFNRGFSGRRRPLFQSSPPRTAAAAFTRLLRRRGVRVRRAGRAGVTPATAVELTTLNSPGVRRLITAMNVPSDNFIAETLIKALGAAFGSAGSTAAGAAVIRSTVSQLGVRTRVVDGSGLSRSNRTSPRAVVSLLTAMDESELAEPFLSSLPVAGRSGTLHDRMRSSAARDSCRAKTGTLSDVSALAGYCDTRGGGRVAFAFLMNHVWPSGARRLQDRMAAALARYSG